MMDTNSHKPSEMNTYFKQVIHNQHLSHGYAFTGPNDQLKRETTQYILQSLACLEKGSNPCQNCAMCQRIEHNQFADVMYVRPEGQTLKVDQIRELKEWLATSPVEAHFKCAVIEQAETMNAAAANALLTFLEEPIENVYLILYSSDIQKLLPTVQSRVQQLYFRQDQETSIADYLTANDIQKNHRPILERFPMEMIQAIIESYDPEIFSDEINQLNAFYRLLMNRSDMAFVSVQTQLKKQMGVNSALQALEYLNLINHEVLMKLVDDNQTSGYQQFVIQELLKKIPIQIQGALDLNQYILECRQQIKANVSPQLAFEYLALKMTQQIKEVNE